MVLSFLSAYQKLLDNKANNYQISLRSPYRKNPRLRNRVHKIFHFSYCNKSIGKNHRMSYYSRSDVNTYVQPELSKAQMLSIVNNKFYIHKSFDIQSDMEFLPYIPTPAPNPKSNEW